MFGSAPPAITLGCTLFSLIFLGCLPHALAATDADDSAILVEKKTGQAEIAISVTCLKVTEATVTFTGRLENMQSSRPLPCVVEVTEPLEQALLFWQQDKYKPWKYDYNFSYQIGLRSQAGSDEHVYELPFEKGRTYRISQGYMGSFTHGKGSDSEYSLDFDMPEGSAVCAARDGTVVGVRQDSSEGGSGRQFKTKANFVVVKHGDGTYANYIHLKKNGALVALTDKVRAGEKIGLSGDTGQASRPHLHFDVYRINQDGTRSTIPVKFRLQDKEGYLQEGASYGH